MYRNSDLKSILRTIIAKKLKPKKHVKILTLPADNFIFERLLEDLYPNVTFEFFCLEKDEDVFKNGCDVLNSGALKRSKVSYIKKSTTEYLSSGLADKHTFDLIWLDYCGQLSPYMSLDFDYVSKLIHDESVVAITLMGRRELATLMDSYRALVPEKVDISNKEIRENIFPAKTQDILSLKTESIFRYLDTSINNMAAPMYLYIFRNHDETDIEIYEMKLNSKKTKIQI